MGIVVRYISHDASEGPPHDIHEPEHGGPVSGLLRVEGGEALGVVGA